MILAAAVASLLITDRGYQCHSTVSCPDTAQIRTAVLDFESDKLNKAKGDWELSAGPNILMIGPHMFVLDGIDKIRCVNETKEITSARCSFRVTWGKKKYRENYIADLAVGGDGWKIVEAKTLVEELR